MFLPPHFPIPHKMLNSNRGLQKIFSAFRMALQKLDPRFLALEVMQSLETNSLVQMRFRKLTAPIFSFAISVIIFSFSYKHKHGIL